MIEKIELAVMAHQAKGDRLLDRWLIHAQTLKGAGQPLNYAWGDVLIRHQYFKGFSR